MDYNNIIRVTDGQLEYLQELVMFAYEMEIPEQKGWDIQTFDNLVDQVCSPTGQPLQKLSHDNPIRCSGVL